MKEIVKRILEAPSYVDLGMSVDLQVFFRDAREVSEYNIEIDKEQKAVIDVKLKKFSQCLAEKYFLSFVKYIGYAEFELFMEEKKEGEIVYSYITAADEMLITEMEVHIS